MIFYFIKEFIIINPVKLTFILLISAMMGFGIRVDDISYQKALDKQDYKYIKRGDYYFIPIFEQNSPSFYKTIDIKKNVIENEFEKDRNDLDIYILGAFPER
jgi:hypothetical protein